MGSIKDPLDGSWARDFCRIYNEQRVEGADFHCAHAEECSCLRKLLDTNPNLSIATAKKIIIQGLPNALKSIDTSL